MADQQHHDVSLFAAQTWAQAHAGGQVNPVEFGHNAAKVYLAALQTLANAGDEEATSAALASLSVPAETWQWLAQLSELVRRRPEAPPAAGSSGAEA